MRNSLLMLAAIVALGCWNSDRTNAQEAPLEPITCTWQLSGDSARGFDAQIFPSRPFDRSTAEATVEAFLAVAGGRLVSAESMHAVDQHMHRIVVDELHDTLNKVHTEDAFESLSQPPAIGSSPRELWIGDWIIERLGKPSRRTLDSGGDSLPSARDRQRHPFDWWEGEVHLLAYRDAGEHEPDPEYAFRCKLSDDDCWYITEMRKWGAELSHPFTSARGVLRPTLEYKWKNFDPLSLTAKLRRFGFWSTELRAKLQVPKTEQGLIDYYFNELQVEGRRLRNYMLAKLSAEWERNVRQFFPRNWDPPEVDLTGSPGPHKSPLSYETIETRNDGTALVVRLSDYFNTEWLFELARTEDRVRIDKVSRRFVATRVRDGEVIETLKEVKDPWTPNVDQGYTAYSIPLFLPK